MTAAPEAPVTSTLPVEEVTRSVRLSESLSDAELRGKARNFAQVAERHAAAGDDHRAAWARRNAARQHAVLAYRADHGLSWGPGIGPRPPSQFLNA